MLFFFLSFLIDRMETKFSNEWEKFERISFSRARMYAR